MTRQTDRESRSSLESTSWQPCPPGTLADCSSRMRSSLRRQQQRERLSIAAGVIASCCLLGLGWFAGWGEPHLAPPAPQPVVRGLTCAEVLPAVDSYLAKDMPAELQQRIAQHLDRCPHCQDHYRRRADELGLQLARWLSSSLGQHLVTNITPRWLTQINS